MRGTTKTAHHAPSGGEDPKLSVGVRTVGGMVIDCDTCSVRGRACHDCVISVFLEISPRPVRLEQEEVDAVDALAAAGLVPPLRLVRPLPGSEPEIAQGIA